MRLRNDLVLRQVGNDYVIIKPETGTADFTKVFTLNAAAAALWQQLQDTDFTAEYAVAQLKLLYGESAPANDVLIKDVDVLISALKQHHMLAE